MPNEPQSKLDENARKNSLPEKIAFALFCATSVQFALFTSFVPIIKGVKVDIYSGALCAITLSCAILATKAKCVKIAWTELVISGVLLTLAILSAVSSVTPWSSTIWSLTWGANSLGGYWAARLLLTSQLRFTIFVWLCAISLDLLLTLRLWGYYFGSLNSYFGFDAHLLVNIILLLSFASLALIISRKILGIIFGISLLLISYAALYVCALGGVESALLIPPIILALALIFTLSKFKSKLAPLIVMLFAVAVSAHYLSSVTTEAYHDKHFQQERLEYYAFSAHILKQSPWIGIGLRTPRTPYLADYTLWHPSYSKEEFATFLSYAPWPHNILLAFALGFGLPFAAIYLFALVLLVIRLFRAAISPRPDSFVPPFALLIPITGAILHFMIMDLLFIPTIAWFFHILLALIPEPLPKRLE